MKVLHSIKPDFERSLPLLNLIKPDNIDFNPIVGAKCALADSPDKIYFKIRDVSGRDILDELLTNNYMNTIPIDEKNYYICYQTNDALCAIGNDTRSKGGITGFAISMNGIFYDEIGEFIGTTQFCKNSFKERLDKYNEDLIGVSEICYNSIVEDVRERVNLQQGEFISDNITKNVYVQRRLTDKGELVDYILNDYYVKVLSDINWVDISNEGTIYSAL